jgi:hypothetical protein
LIQNARQKALRAVDAVQVQTCWEIGRHIIEFEQGGSARAEYGTGLLQTLASSLAAEFGRGFDVSNLRHMRVFYQAFPIRDALRPELSWTHYRTLLRVEGDSARQWYMNEAAGRGWTTRSLERQISTLYYERLLATSDRTAVESEARGNLAPSQTPRDFVRDPVMLEFLGLPGVGRLLEADLVASRPIHLAVIDGIYTMTAGELPYQVGGQWVNQAIHPGLLIAGMNCVATDAVATAIMGFDPMADRGTPPFQKCDSTLQLAESLGVGTRDLTRIEVVGPPIEKVRYPYPLLTHWG